MIAEGVELEEQLARLRHLNCDKAQGFMFSRPMDAITAGKYIQDATRGIVHDTKASSSQ